jgi:hypothetical protein
MSAALLCLFLVPGLAEAAAKVKSHSNTNNNRFAQSCVSGGGKVGGTDAAPTCAIPKLDASAKESLRAACVKDGGLPTEAGGGMSCALAGPTTSH